MSFIYLLALVGVGIAIVFTLAEAVISASRPAQWKRASRLAFVHLVDSESRRTRQLPFVGAERRQADEQHTPPEVDTRRVA